MTELTKEQLAEIEARDSHKIPGEVRRIAERDRHLLLRHIRALEAKLAERDEKPEPTSRILW